jgi:plasmid stabilization system protein ParE
LGQPRDDLFPGCREINIEQHVVYCEPQASDITVVRVLHSHQDPTGKVEKPRS